MRVTADEKVARVSRWLARLNTKGVEPDQPNLDDLGIRSEPDADESHDLSELDISRLVNVVNSTSYAWLKKSVQSRARLDFASASTLMSIRKTVAATLAVTRGSQALQTQSVVVEMHWDPLTFMKEQGYEGSHSLPSALTITSGDDGLKAQLLSCSQYLGQTWPLIGEVILSGLMEVIASVENVDQLALPSQSIQSR
jgi:hypothetical protein